jgi:hypothetical protein
MTYTPYTQGAGFLLVVTIIGLLAFVVQAQSTTGQEQEGFEGFVSGIRANAVKGEVFYQRADGKFDLESGLKLQEGDFIKSGPNSYAELLLQPGNYLRVGADSECEIVSDQHDKMRLRLNRGSISLEVLSKDGENSANFAESLSQLYELTRIITPNAEVFVTRPGIFRINAWGAQSSELIVRAGEAVINGRLVKEKRSAMVSKEGVTIADINSKTVDGFDSWGRERADELVQANKLLKKESPWANKRKEGKETSLDLPEDEAPGNKSRFVVSAKPGAITFVDAGVEFSRPTKEWEPVTEKSQLESGDRLRTSAHSFAELTMLPDLNLRIDGESEILFEQLSNEAISLKLLRGSAILDVVRFDRKQLPEISLAGASTSVTIDDDGNYRINTGTNGDEITVRGGKVIFQERSVGSCRKIAGGTVSECDKKRSDNFDFWSEHRGEGDLYNGRTTVAMVAHLDRLRQIRYRNKGFWFQYPGKTHCTFVPFSSPLFRSPYGGSYSTVLSPQRAPTIRFERIERPPWGRRIPGAPVAPPQL